MRVIEPPSLQAV